MQISRRIYFTLRRLLILWSSIFLGCATLILLAFLIRDYPVSIFYIIGLGIFGISAWGCYWYAKIDADKEAKFQEEVMRKLSISDDDSDDDPYEHSSSRLSSISIQALKRFPNKQRATKTTIK
jgi:hypothetical protein